MLENRLVLNGVEVDLLTKNVSINKQVNGLNQFDNRQVDVTENFKLAFTQKNHEFFNFINVHSSKSDSQTILIESVLYLGTTSVFEGFCRVVKVVLSGDVGYIVRLVSKIKTIKQLLSDTKLSDLDFSSINHSKTINNVVSRMQNVVNVGYTYAIQSNSRYTITDGDPVIVDNPTGTLLDDFRTLRIEPHSNYLTNNVNNNVDVIEFPETQPLLYLSWIMDRISDLVGKNFIGSVFATKDYIEEVRNLNKAAIENPRFYFIPNDSGVPNDPTDIFIDFSKLVHDVDLWTIFSDFLISYGQIFIEETNNIKFVSINDIENGLDDWTPYLVKEIEMDFDVPLFGQNSNFSYKKNAFTENLLQNTGVIDFDNFDVLGFHVEPYEFSVSISNVNLDLNKDIYESEFYNQWDRVFVSDQSLSYSVQTSNPYPVIEYTIRVCDRFEGNLLFSDLHRTFETDLNISINSVNDLLTYQGMLNNVLSQLTTPSQKQSAESKIKLFYENLSGNAPMMKYRIKSIDTRLLMSGVLNKNNGVPSSNKYLTQNYGAGLYNFLEPVKLNDTKVNNQKWFDIIDNYKQNTFELYFDLLTFKNIDLTRSKIINGVKYYVSKIEKYKNGEVTKVKMVKIE